MVGAGRDGTGGEVLDVAGVPIAVEATDPARAALGALVLAGSSPTHAEPLAWLVVDHRGVEVPADPPRDESMGVRLWVHDHGITVAAGDTVGTATGDRISLHVPGLEDAPVVETIAPMLLGWVMARHDRFVVHGGAVARGDAALLVLGHSGAGKSTLVAAAIEHGWRALADDLVVLEADDGVLRVHGLHRAPAVPMEIGGPVVGWGAPLDGSRRRAELPRAVLTAGGFRLVGTVVAAHAAGADGEIHPAGHQRVVPLLLQSFAGTVDPDQRVRFFAFTEHVSVLPAWTLAHAGDAGSRRAHVGAALEQVLAEARVSDPAA